MSTQQGGAAYFETLEEILGENFSIRDQDYDEENESEVERYEEAEEDLLNFALSVERKVVYRVNISVGGPSAWLEIEVSDDSIEIIHIKYHYAWWGDEYSTYVPEGSPMWRWVEENVYFS